MVGDQNFLNMEVMNFSNNAISFEAGKMQLQIFTDKLRKFVKLRNLNIEHNKFVDVNYMHEIRINLPNRIELFNGKPVEANQNIYQ